MTRAAFNSVETKPLMCSAGPTRRSLWRSMLMGLAAAGAVACPCITSAQVINPPVDPNKAIMSDGWRRAPRNVAYYFSANPQISLDQIATANEGAFVGLAYTDVIIGFLEPDPASNYTTLHGDGAAFQSPYSDNDYFLLRTDIQKLRASGRNVLLSVGGQVFPNGTVNGWTSERWKACNQNVLGLVSQILFWVQKLGVNGVDIDYEDSDALTSPGSAANNAGYDGVTFLESLTSQLYMYLPPNGGLITHSPAPGYWDPNSQWKAAYYYVNSNVGKYIAWYNTQFYYNPGYDEDVPNNKVSWYTNISQEIGPQKLVMGVAITDPMNPVPRSVDIATMQNDIAELQNQFNINGAEFGGVMSWQFASDPNGAWGEAIGTALNSQVLTGTGFYTAPPY